MRVLIVSDIHSNFEALQAVIKDATVRGGFDQIWSVGDIVGYGPSPRECIEVLRQHDTISIAGNHDLACTGQISPNEFNSHAASAAWWTITQLSYEDYVYLGDLPQKIETDYCTIVHGSAQEPFWREYLLSPEAALSSWEKIDTAMCLVGHSHRSFVCRPENGSAVFNDFPGDDLVPVNGDPMIVNPGSVGQPRDRDPRASYAIYDIDRAAISNHRAEYDVKLTQRKMAECELPKYLIERIAYGI